MTSTRLILLCGLPGAGKTTLARRLAPAVPAVRLCPDEWLRGLGVDLFDETTRDRLEVLFWVHTRELLALGQSVILESGFWSRSERDQKRLACRDLGVAVELRYLHAPLDKLTSRLARRPGEPRINRAHLVAWSAQFEAPDAAELALFDPPA